MTIRTPLALLLLVAVACGGGGGGGATTGEELAADIGCLSCHTDETTSLAPTWQGLAGSEVELEDGTTVVADTEYLRRSIVEPHADIVAGYGPTMPMFHLDEEEVDLLVAYIEELGQ